MDYWSDYEIEPVTFPPDDLAPPAVEIPIPE
jgi:hypothetical protein